MNLEPRVSCASHNSLPRAKDKKRQKELGLNVQALFHNPSECNKLHPPSHLSVRSVLLHFVQRSPPETRTLYKGGKKVYLFYSARFSHFIDSLNAPCKCKVRFFSEKYNHTELLIERLILSVIIAINSLFVGLPLSD